MILSSAQVSWFWREWSAACRAQGWTRAAGMTSGEIDGHRKAFLVRCGFRSLTDVDKTAGFTKVMNELRLLKEPDLDAAREVVDPGLNEARVLRHVILTDLIPCLELYVEDARHYLSQVFFNQGGAMRDFKLMELNASQLTRVRSTIAARLNGLRKAAGDSIHGMRTRAGVPCTCAQCRAAAAARAQAAAAAPTVFLAPLHGAAEQVKIEQPF